MRQKKDLLRRATLSLRLSNFQLHAVLVQITTKKGGAQKERKVRTREAGSGSIQMERTRTTKGKSLVKSHTKPNKGIKPEPPPHTKQARVLVS